MICTFETLHQIFPNYKGEIQKEITINEIMTDSRTSHECALFVPIVGDNFNGHDFIQGAVKNGAIAALWDKTIDIPDNVPASFLFFLVDDTVKGLQQLAKAYREKINPTVIGITGSNGKTTTKDLLYAVLKEKYRTHATAGNFNNHIGLPLTILQMPATTEMLILEMGMNHFLEIDVLTKIAEPDYAVITNIGESHIEHLGSRAGIAKAKLEITNGLHKEGLLIIDGDELLLQRLRKEPHVITCGFGDSNNVQVTDVELRNNETTFEIERSNYSIPLLGTHHAKNASYVVTIAKKLGMKTEEIMHGLQSLRQSDMRFEWITGKNGVTLINDAYNASATSMKAAIEVVKQLDDFTRKIVVLGDILELGTYAVEMHQAVAEAIDTPIDYVFTYGTHAKTITDTVAKKKSTIKVKHVDTKEELIHLLEKYVTMDTVILFKASRGMAFEQLVDSLR